MKIEIKYHADIPKIEKIEIGDWIDLRAAEECYIPFGCYTLISLGVSMRLPEGYEAIVAPRSSTYKRYKILMANGIGIIDNSYSGTNDVWGFPAIAFGGTAHIKKGDRICQFRIQKKMPEIELVEVDKLDDKGRGGFGSTGVE